MERVQTAERERLEVQLTESSKKEEREAAREARRARLQPALDLLAAFELVVGAYLESSAIDAWRTHWENEFGQFNNEAWEEAKLHTQTVSAPAYTTIVGEYFPKIAAIPIPDLVSKLQLLIAAAVSMPSIPKMNASQRKAFLANMRGIRDEIDAEIVRGNWP